PGSAGAPALPQGGQAGESPVGAGGAAEGGTTEIVVPSEAGSGGGGVAETIRSPMLGFVGANSPGQNNVYGLPLIDGAELVKLSSAMPSGYQAGHPSVAPSGDSLAFIASNSQAQNELWVVGTDGSNPHSITEAAIPGDHLDLVLWSPDSQSL